MSEKKRAKKNFVMKYLGNTVFNDIIIKYNLLLLYNIIVGF